IHNCWDRNQQSVLGQFSIGRVGQFSISANSTSLIVSPKRPESPANRAITFDGMNWWMRDENAHVSTMTGTF
ncbi:hypothetical protein, partial [Pseudomonas avellanae]|uniref:hypothetical protein n=1 Tax=Pseudomonas avellanae TaxID=46257 RepID=UPI0005CB6D53